MDALIVKSEILYTGRVCPCRKISNCLSVQLENVYVVNYFYSSDIYSYFSPIDFFKVARNVGLSNIITLKIMPRVMVIATYHHVKRL